jgi:CelD/BcsL family acetyltransferase involved in cellulose biosynthesis
MFPELPESLSAPAVAGAVRVEKIDDIEGFDSLRSVWDEIVDKTPDATVFQTFAWNRCWWRIYGGDHRLNILRVESDGAVIGIAPLMITERGGLTGRKRTIRLIGTSNADYLGFVGTEMRLVVNSVLSYLGSHLDDWDMAEFDQVPESSGTFTSLVEILPPSNLRYESKAVETCMSYVYGGDEKARAGFKIKRDKVARNCLNYFNALGELKLEIYSDPDEIRDRLPGFFHSHIVRWHSTSTPSKFLGPKNRLFYEELVNSLAPLDMIQLAVLSLSGRPVAGLFNYRFRKGIFLYTSTYDLYHSRKSPGVILALLLIEKAVHDGFDIIDFMRGPEKYKNDFCTRATRNFEFRIYNSALPLAKTRAIAALKKYSGYDALPENSPIRAFKDNLAHAVAAYGLMGALRNIVGSLGRRLVDPCSLEFFEYAPGSEIPAQVRLPFEIRLKGPEDIEVIASFLGARLATPEYAVLERRFASGAECYAAFMNQAVAGVAWVFHHDAASASPLQYIHLNADEVVIFGTRTSPVFNEFEPNRVLKAHIGALYTSRNYRALAAEYRSSKEGCEASLGAGFRRLSTIRRVNLFGSKRCPDWPVRSSTWKLGP